MKASVITTCVGLFAVSLLVSCKDEDPEITSSIIGKWKGDRSEITVSYGFITLHEEEDDVFDVTLEFKEDGKVLFTRDGTTTSGTYQLNGDQLTTNVDFQFDEVELETLNFDILELTPVKLRLDLEQDQEVEVPDVGLVNTTIKGDFAFDRL